MLKLVELEGRPLKKKQIQNMLNLVEGRSLNIFIKRVKESSSLDLKFN